MVSLSIANDKYDRKRTILKSGSINRRSMFIKDLAKCDYFLAHDDTRLCEFIHPAKDHLDLPYSVAHAIVKPGLSSLRHRLMKSSEVYIILNGAGEMSVDGECSRVKAGQAVFIPPGSWQNIRNTGEEELRFLCIVYPMWHEEDEENASLGR